MMRARWWWWSRQRRRRAVLAIAAAATVAGCSSPKKTFDGWFGTSEAESAAHDGEGSLYYAAVGGLTVHEEAAGSSKVIGHLSQYEQVKRTRLEHGYAFVTAEKSGLEGWVDNAQLIWRLPTNAERKPVAEEGGDKGAADDAPPAESDETKPAAPQQTEAPTPTSTPSSAPTPAAAPPTAEVPPTPPVPPTAPPTTPSPTKPRAEMYDPF